MPSRFKFAGRYSSQLWLLFWGTLAGSMGQSLIWPFLTIYIRERLGVPLTTVTLLFTLQSIAGFTATALLGPIMDHAGRKLPMIAGSVASGITLVLMSQAASLWHWAILMPLYGMVNTVFRVGCYAMVADTVEPQRRAEVYALLRTGDNTGFTIGPALGGFLISVAYLLSYLLAAATQFLLAIFVSIIIHETLIRRTAAGDDATSQSAGYGAMLHDRAFMSVWGLFILVSIASSLVFVLLGVYVKENYHVSEDHFGFIIGTNAILVVIFQYTVTQRTQRYPPLKVMSQGALVYAVGMVLFSISRSFEGFLFGMVIFTVGEMLIAPTGTALVANISPPDMRARYIGLYSLSFRVAAGIGPVLGGLLSDHLAPVATWYGGIGICLLAALGFFSLSKRWHQLVRPVEALPLAPAETTIP